MARNTKATEGTTLSRRQGDNTVVGKHAFTFERILFLYTLLLLVIFVLSNFFWPSCSTLNCHNRGDALRRLRRDGGCSEQCRRTWRHYSIDGRTATSRSRGKDSYDHNKPRYCAVWEWSWNFYHPSIPIAHHRTALHRTPTPTAPLPHRSHGPACETAVYLRFSTRSRLFYLVSQYVILISVTPHLHPPCFSSFLPLYFSSMDIQPSFLPSFLPYTNQLQNKGLAWWD